MNLPVNPMVSNLMSNVQGSSKENFGAMQAISAEMMEFQTLIANLTREQSTHSMVLHAKQEAIKSVADFARDSMRKSS